MTERLQEIHDWLQGSLGLGGYELAPASGDASFRRYFRVRSGGKTFIVMDAPPGREDCRPYVDISRRLLECGVRAPAVHAQDLERGLLLLDDLGTTLYLEVLNPGTAGRLYRAAVESLLRMQAGARRAGLPTYDAALLESEMHLFRDWLLGRHLQLEADAGMLEECFGLLREAALEQPVTFVHRDYHSRNLLVDGDGRPGVLDFQDAVIGPVTYDLVSLYKDCYIKWPRLRVVSWALDYHRRSAGALNYSAGEAQFLRWFDLMGVQRQLKASGIFARLYHRDGKPGYLPDVPRTLSYILDLEPDYPELGPLIRLVRGKVLPALDRRGLP